MPLTVNGPPTGPVTTPGDVEPSPQSIVAVKSATVAPGLASVNVAVLPLNEAVETVGVAQLAASGASATVVLPVTEVLAPPSSRTDTFTGYDPSSAYWWLPKTVKDPPVGPVTRPGLVAPSPQVIVAVKSLAGANGFASVNLNEALPGLTPSTPPVSVRAPGESEASPTRAVDVAV